MDLNSVLFRFPELDNVFCLFQGIPNMPGVAGKAWGNPGESVILRNELLKLYGSTGLESFCACKQVHGTHIVTNPDILKEEAPPAEADGLCTDEAGKALLIKTADCQPILFAERSGKYIMAIHSGWRGNRANFPFIAVKFFANRYKLSPGDIFAVRGPSLCPACAEFINFENEWGPRFERWYNPATQCVDLWAMTNDQLIEAGIPREQIYAINICTRENTGKFFSYRKNKNCGRQASMIWKSS